MPVVPQELKRQLDALVGANESIGAAAGLPGLVPRVWALPDGLLSSLDVQDPANFRAAVTRYELNDKYRQALETGPQPGGGTLAELVAYKSAIDYLAMMERALHARHASRVRCASWAAARRAGHGDAQYGIFSAIARDIQTTLASSGRPGIP